MLTILHILNTGSFSGAENVVVTLLSFLDKSEYRTVYVSLDGTIRENLMEYGIEFEPVSRLCPREIRRIIKKYNPDIVHAHDFTAGVVCSVSTLKPIINHLHNNSPWLKKLNIKNIIYTMSCFRYKAIITVSSAIMDEYLFGDVFKRKAVLIGNPTDRNRIVSLAGQMNRSFDVAFLGRLTREKNPYAFLRIVSRINKQRDISSIMIGDGELRKGVEDYIQSEHLEKMVKVIGFKKNPFVFLNQARILCIPSLWEGYGLAAVEALSLGIPVVAASVGGLRDIITSECGVLCTKEEDYIYAILMLLDNADIYKKMSAAAKKRVADLNSPEEYATKISMLYHGVAQ